MYAKQQVSKQHQWIRFKPSLLLKGFKGVSVVKIVSRKGAKAQRV